MTYAAIRDAVFGPHKRVKRRTRLRVALGRLPAGGEPEMNPRVDRQAEPGESGGAKCCGYR